MLAANLLIDGTLVAGASKRGYASRRSIIGAIGKQVVAISFTDLLAEMLNS